MGDYAFNPEWLTSMRGDSTQGRAIPTNRVGSGLTGRVRDNGNQGLLEELSTCPSWMTIPNESIDSPVACRTSIIIAGDKENRLNRSNQVADSTIPHSSAVANNEESLIELSLLRARVNESEILQRHIQAKNLSLRSDISKANARIASLVKETKDFQDHIQFLRHISSPGMDTGALDASLATLRGQELQQARNEAADALNGFSQSESAREQLLADLEHERRERLAVVESLQDEIKNLNLQLSRASILHKSHSSRYNATEMRFQEQLKHHAQVIEEMKTEHKAAMEDALSKAQDQSQAKIAVLENRIGELEENSAALRETSNSLAKKVRYYEEEASRAWGELRNRDARDNLTDSRPFEDERVSRELDRQRKELERHFEQERMELKQKIRLLQRRTETMTFINSKNAIAVSDEPLTIREKRMKNGTTENSEEDKLRVVSSSACPLLCTGTNTDISDMTIPVSDSYADETSKTPTENKEMERDSGSVEWERLRRVKKHGSALDHNEVEKVPSDSAAVDSTYWARAYISTGTNTDKDPIVSRLTACQNQLQLATKELNTALDEKIWNMGKYVACCAALAACHKVESLKSHGDCFVSHHQQLSDTNQKLEILARNWEEQAMDSDEELSRLRNDILQRYKQYVFYSAALKAAQLQQESKQQQLIVANRKIKDGEKRKSMMEATLLEAENVLQTTVSTLKEKQKALKESLSAKSRLEESKAMAEADLAIAENELTRLKNELQRANNSSKQMSKANLVCKETQTVPKIDEQRKSSPILNDFDQLPPRRTHKRKKHDELKLLQRRFAESFKHHIAQVINSEDGQGFMPQSFSSNMNKASTAEYPADRNGRIERSDPSLTSSISKGSHKRALDPKQLSKTAKSSSFGLKTTKVSHKNTADDQKWSAEESFARWLRKRGDRPSLNPMTKVSFRYPEN